MALAGHELDALVETGVAQRDGGVAAVEQLIDDLTLFQTGQSTVLPQDGGCVGGGTLQALVAAAQRTVAQLQPLVEDLPEFLNIAAGGQGHVRKIDGHHTLIEPTIVFVLAGLIIPGVGDVAPPQRR